MTNVLEFAFSDRRPIISAAAGRGVPVWPISNDFEFKRLRIFASCFHIELRQAEAVPGVAPVTSSGTVVAYGSGTESAAQLYAHLTGRSYARAKSVEELARLQSVEAVVTQAEGLNERFLRTVEESSSTSRPGLILGHTPQDLFLQVLLCSATTKSPLPRDNGRIDFFPWFDMAVRSVTPDHLLVGGNASEAAIEELLNKGCGVLNVFTHSDGVCAKFSPKVLCPADGWLPEWASGRVPTCLKMDYCRKLKVPFGEALTRRERLRPETLTSYIALLNVCFGFMMEGSAVNGLFSYARQLITGGRVGALVTARGLLVGSPTESLELANMVSRGMPLGRALASAASLPFYKSGRARLTLFGDPRIRVAPTLAAVPLRKPTPPRHYEDREPHAFLVALLRQMAVSGDLGTAECERLIERLSAPQLSLQTRAEVLELLAATGPNLCRQWLRLGTTPEAICYDDRCHACSELCVTFLVRMNFRSARSRFIVACPNCGVVDDTTTRDRGAGLHLLPGFRVRLTGIDTSEDWTGGFCVETFDQRVRVWTLLPEHSIEGHAIAREYLEGYTAYVSCSFFILTASGQLRVVSRLIDASIWH